MHDSARIVQGEFVIPRAKWEAMVQKAVDAFAGCISITFDVPRGLIGFPTSAQHRRATRRLIRETVLARRLGNPLPDWRAR